MQVYVKKHTMAAYSAAPTCLEEKACTEAVANRWVLVPIYLF
jgi:hypothetical protein